MDKRRARANESDDREVRRARMKWVWTDTGSKGADLGCGLVVDLPFFMHSEKS